MAYPVHFEVEHQERYSRLSTFFRVLLIIPHLIFVLLWGVVAEFLVFLAWFAILFTGRYPRWAFDYNVGVMRWGLRVEAYALLLATDRYPPFSL